MIESGRPAHLVTLNRDGSPQVSCVWVGLDGDEIVSAHLNAEQQKLRNIRRDPRVPMMEVYDLYAGKLKPDDVLAAAKAGDPSPEVLNNQLFYAHLYLGLYYDAAGEAKLAGEHMDEAVKHKIGHYMWDVAKVHAEVLKKAREAKK